MGYREVVITLPSGALWVSGSRTVKPGVPGGRLTLAAQEVRI